MSEEFDPSKYQGMNVKTLQIIQLQQTHELHIKHDKLAERFDSASGRLRKLEHWRTFLAGAYAAGSIAVAAAWDYLLKRGHGG